MGGSESSNKKTTPNVSTEKAIETVKNYKLVKELGKGAFGKVYLAVDEKANKYAIKKISGNFDEAEIKAQMATLHDNVVKIHQYFYSPENNSAKCLYIVMELCTGPDLEKILSEMKSGKLQITDEQKISWFLELLGALKSIHDSGVIHRDLKPSNILVHDNGSKKMLKIADFGISKVLDKGEQFTQTVCGTILYMAPELLSGKYNQTVDVWSLGLVFLQVYQTEVDQKILHCFYLLAHQNPLIFVELTKDIELKDPAVHSLLSTMLCPALKRKTTTDLLNSTISNVWRSLLSNNKQSLLKELDKPDICIALLSGIITFTGCKFDLAVEVLPETPDIKWVEYQPRDKLVAVIANRALPILLSKIMEKPSASLLTCFEYLITVLGAIVLASVDNLFNCSGLTKTILSFFYKTTPLALLKLLFASKKLCCMVLTLIELLSAAPPCYPSLIRLTKSHPYLIEFAVLCNMKCYLRAHGALLSSEEKLKKIDTESQWEIIGTLSPRQIDGVRKKFTSFISNTPLEKGSHQAVITALLGFSRKLHLMMQIGSILNICKVVSSGGSYYSDGFFQCVDCFKDDHTKGVCVHCASACHKGHKIIWHERTSFTSCSCGPTCKVQKASPIKFIMKETPAKQVLANRGLNKSQLPDKGEVSDRMIKPLSPEAPNFNKVNNYSSAEPLCEITSIQKGEQAEKEVTTGYYEVTIMNADSDFVVGLGVSLPGHKPNEMPGWSPISIGYHSDDGQVFFNLSTDNKSYSKQIVGPHFYEGDVIGCGVTNHGRVYFTLNGCYIGECPQKLPAGLVNAVIGIKGRVNVYVNFGKYDFTFESSELKDYLSCSSVPLILDKEIVEHLRTMQLVIKYENLDEDMQAQLNLLNSILYPSTDKKIKNCTITNSLSISKGNLAGVQLNDNLFAMLNQSLSKMDLSQSGQAKSTQDPSFTPRPPDESPSKSSQSVSIAEQSQKETNASIQNIEKKSDKWRETAATSSPRLQTSHTSSINSPRKPPPSLPKSRPPANIYVALYDYIPEETGHVTLKEGDVVQMKREEGEWCVVQLNGAIGFVPTNFLKKLSTT